MDIYLINNAENSVVFTGVKVFLSDDVFLQ